MKTNLGTLIALGYFSLCLVPHHKATAQYSRVVTDMVYFDITIDGEPAGRIIFGLFGNDTPKTVENFIRLAVHDKGYGYKGSRFTLIQRGYTILGGAFKIGKHRGGLSWFGAPFAPENYDLKHYGPGWVSMASVGVDDIGSQFFIVTDELYGMREFYDNRYVVFAVILHGMDIVLKIEEQDTLGMILTKPVIVAGCGTIKVTKPLIVEEDYITEDIVSILGDKLWTD